MHYKNVLEKKWQIGIYHFPDYNPQNRKEPSILGGSIVISIKLYFVILLLPALHNNGLQYIRQTLPIMYCLYFVALYRSGIDRKQALHPEKKGGSFPG